MLKMINVLLLIPGIIHLLPVYGLFGSDVISKLYGVQIVDPNVMILMQHRAILFGLLGGIIILSIFIPLLRFYACVAGLISATSFVVIALLAGEYNGELNKVLYADYVAIACLLLVLILECRIKNIR